MLRCHGASSTSGGTQPFPNRKKKHENTVAVSTVFDAASIAQLHIANALPDAGLSPEER